jgi:hypothetical protein
MSKATVKCIAVSEDSITRYDVSGYGGIPFTGVYLQSNSDDGERRGKITSSFALVMIMANEENLKKGKATQFRTGEEQAEIARQGGIASGKARNLKARLKEWAEDGGYEKMLAMADEQIAEGNTKMWELIRDTIGEKPVDRVQIQEIDQDIIDEVEAMVFEDDEERSGNISEE